MAFNRRHARSEGELEEALERLEVEEEVATKEAEIAEKEAVIAQLKKQHGSDWARILGVNKLTDLSTLRSFLQSAKRSMERAGSPSYPALHPANMRGIRKA